MCRLCCSIILVFCLANPSLAAAPTPAESRVESVSLFKNGLAVVQRVVQVPGPGEYILVDVPEPVHGTFWIQSDAVVETRVTTHEIEIRPDFRVAPDFQQDLAGREVAISLKDAGGAPAKITGRVLGSEASDSAQHTWSRAYERDSYNQHSSSWSGGMAARSGYIVIQTQAGRVYVDSSAILTLEVADAPQTMRVRRPVMLFSVSSAKGAISGPISISVSYLAKGITWAPAYRLDLGAESALELVQQAVIRNELEDLRDVEISLISGFPSVEFSHVVSPLSPRSSIAGFFQQLSIQGGLRHFSRGDVMTQRAVMTNVADDPAVADFEPESGGASTDLHVESIGLRTLAVGDSMMVTVAAGAGRYERLVEWIIPDNRDEFGRLIEDYQRRDREESDDVPWDAVRFRNPLSMPLTTAPAMIVSAGRFNGQRLMTWTNAGEMTSLRITKALSVRAKCNEIEEAEGDREIVKWGGRTFRRTPVRGELSLHNWRSEPVVVLIRRRFSGELVEADANPGVTFLESGVWSVNRRNELTWTITLAPGQEQTLTYRTSVLVHH